MASKEGAAQDVESAPRVFSYKPKGGGDPIELPLEFEKPGKSWFWEHYDKGFMPQTFEWMKLAGVPRDVQRRLVDLPDDEYLDVFTKWFDAIGGGSPGE